MMPYRKPALSITWKLRSLLALCAAMPACFAPTQAEDPLPGPSMLGAVTADSTNERSAMASILLPVSGEEAAAWITQSDHLERWFCEKVQMGGVGEPFIIGYPSLHKEWTGKLVELDPKGRLVAEVMAPNVGKPITITLDHAEEGGFERVTFSMGTFGKEMADEVVAGGFREGMSDALEILKLAAAGEKTTPKGPPVVERVFHPLETPREGLEAEMRMKAAAKPPVKSDSP